MVFYGIHLKKYKVGDLVIEKLPKYKDDTEAEIAK